MKIYFCLGLLNILFILYEYQRKRSISFSGPSAVGGLPPTKSVQGQVLETESTKPLLLPGPRSGAVTSL